MDTDLGGIRVTNRTADRRLTWERMRTAARLCSKVDVLMPGGALMGVVGKP